MIPAFEYILWGSKARFYDGFDSKNCAKIEANVSEIKPDTVVQTIVPLIKKPLSERIQIISENDSIKKVKVDEFFSFEVKNHVAGLDYWHYAKTYAWLSTTIALLSATGFTYLAASATTPLVIIATAVTAIAFALITGFVWARYSIASEQKDIFQNPGRAFAIARKTAYEKGFPHVFKKNLKWGTPHGIVTATEVKVLYFNHLFKQTKPFLKTKPSTPKDQHDWVESWLKLNPHPLDSNVIDFSESSMNNIGLEFATLKQKIETFPQRLMVYQKQPSMRALFEIAHIEIQKLYEEILQTDDQKQYHPYIKKSMLQIQTQVSKILRLHEAPYSAYYFALRHFIVESVKNGKQFSRYKNKTVLIDQIPDPSIEQFRILFISAFYYRFKNYTPSKNRENYTHYLAKIQKTILIKLNINPLPQRS